MLSYLAKLMCGGLYRMSAEGLAQAIGQVERDRERPVLVGCRFEEDRTLACEVAQHQLVVAERRAERPDPTVLCKITRHENLLRRERP